MSVEQWENYYRNGFLATGPTGADGSYDLELRQAWTEFFSTLSDGARVLDIGTGNGVVAMIAAQTAAARGQHFEIHASDLARIDPVRHVANGAQRLAGIAFHPEVATERLPFEAESFDAVSGHYALEYGKPRESLAQIHRVLKPGSDAQFILHHADSILVQNALRSMRETEFVLKDTKLYRKLHRLVTLEQASPELTQRVTAELRHAIQAVKHALTQARRIGAGMVFEAALDAVQKLLIARKQLPGPSAGREVDRAENQLRGSWRRLNDLVQHARTSAHMDELQALAAEAGFTRIECLPQHHGGQHLVGWQLLLHRP